MRIISIVLLCIIQSSLFISCDESDPEKKCADDEVNEVVFAYSLTSTPWDDPQNFTSYSENNQAIFQISGMVRGICPDKHLVIEASTLSRFPAPRNVGVRLSVNYGPLGAFGFEKILNRINLTETFTHQLTPFEFGIRDAYSSGAGELVVYLEYTIDGVTTYAEDLAYFKSIFDLAEVSLRYTKWTGGL